jgi:tRNA(Ile)-lysidine synthase
MLAGTLTGVTLRHSQALDSLIFSARPNSRLALPHGVAAVREYDELIFQQRVCHESDTGFELWISAPGSYQLPCGGSITVETVAGLSLSQHSGTAYFDLAGSPFPWMVRSFRAGDRMIPVGMSGRKKVKDIFIDRKIPLSERRTVPLLFCRDDLIWVAGVCRSGPSRPDSSATSLIKVSWRSRNDTFSER